MPGMYNKEWSAWRNSNYEFFRKHLSSLPKDLKLIDLGAGALQFGSIFKQFNYTGVDFENYPDVSIVTDLTKRLPIENNSADIVTLSNTLEHIPYPLHVLEECHRILRKGGMVVATTPFLIPVHQAPFDFNRYTHFQLRKLLEDAGFKDIEVRPLGRQIDAYNTIELKTFDELYKVGNSVLLKLIRIWRRTEMRVLRRLFASIPASTKVTEGYGLFARK